MVSGTFGLEDLPEGGEERGDVDRLGEHVVAAGLQRPLGQGEERRPDRGLPIRRGALLAEGGQRKLAGSAGQAVRTPC